ncbi:zinc transport system ATP-binding protein [Streptomyces zhaozhouensis]|uniref:Zinc transport system ATP-binding protein n=1 Tax=Streptomyces zhaozhouensis TaxID=1300267 RepID=A0A286E0L9_9ACTN|nr:ATP-binding cassette domain-containing protein [Streptomyces zhaozhouensis]SOD64442.1 zinc transport system ATP-binding protein [Streptomyces zhaozhouensis]
MEREAEPVIGLDEVSAELGGRPVLRGVSLTVGRGEVVALLGANGSGKSTAVRAVVGQVPVTEGRLTLFGTPVRRFSDWSRVGYVPQRSTAAGGVPATVREVVAAGRLARRRLRPMRRADREAIDLAIERVGLAERAGEPVDALSGGQHQRVLIARALTVEPELLVMDEPLAGVDLDSQRVLAETLRSQVEGGASVLLVLHELGPLAPLIDRAVVLGHGRVERTVDSPSRLPEDSHPCHPADALEPSAEPSLQTGIL